MSKVRPAAEITIRIVSFTAIFVAVAAVPYWFEQAFAYSGTLGRSEPEARAAGTLFGCRARFTEHWAFGLVVFSCLTTTLQRCFIGERTWSYSLGRSLVEQVMIGLGCWIMLRWIGVPIILATGFARLADRVCR